jgi:hypothetical protein
VSPVQEVRDPVKERKIKINKMRIENGMDESKDEVQDLPNAPSNHDSHDTFLQD